jgi:hypothetical protein
LENLKIRDQFEGSDCFGRQGRAKVSGGPGAKLHLGPPPIFLIIFVIVIVAIIIIIIICG